MFTPLLTLTWRKILAVSAAAGVIIVLAAGSGRALPPSNTQERISTASGAVAQESPAKIIVDAPPQDELAKGVAIVRFRTENARMLPVFGPAAATISPRIGHFHVTLDDAPWHWAHTSGDPVIVAPLSAGPHKILLELADANHNVLASETVKFVVPRQ